MKSAQVIVVSLLMLCLIKPVAAAATYYVNNSGSPACSDSSTNGSATKPWCTPQYGVAHIAGGDTLYVRAGSYNIAGGYWAITGPSGSAGQPTVISAYPGETVNFLPTDTSTKIRIGNPTPPNGTVISYMDIVGITFPNNGSNLFETAITVAGGDHINLKNLTVYHAGQEGILIHYNSSNVTVDNVTIHDTGFGAYDGEGMYIGSSTSETYNDNTNNVTIKNSTIYNASDECIELKSGTHDVLIDGNTLYNCNNVAYSSGGNHYGGAAIEVNEAVSSGAQSWGSNPNHIIRNNTIHHSGTSGDPTYIQSGIRLGTGSTAYNNVVYDIIGTGIGIYLTNGMFGNSDSYPRVVYHNTVDVTSARAITTSGSPTTDIRNNIGPNSTNNMATNSAYFVNAAGRDYHLVSGAAPIDAGLNLTSTAPTDKDGVVRPQGVAPDVGAYEYVGGSRPNPPTDLTVIVQ